MTSIYSFHNHNQLSFCSAELNYVGGMGLPTGPKVLLGDLGDSQMEAEQVRWRLKGSGSRYLIVIVKVSVSCLLKCIN